MIRVMVTRAGDEPRLHTFEGAAIEVGSSEACDLQLTAPGVSRRHCRLEVRGGGIELRDLGSSNGTYVNRERLTAARIVDPEDRIDIPGFALAVPAGVAHGRASPAAPTPAATAPAPTPAATSAAPAATTPAPPRAPTSAARAGFDDASAWPDEGSAPSITRVTSEPSWAPALLQARAQAWHERPDHGHLLRGEALREGLAWQAQGGARPGSREAALIAASVAAGARERRRRWWVSGALAASLVGGSATAQGLLAGGAAAHARSLGVVAAAWGSQRRAELRDRLCRARATETAALLREHAGEAADEALRRASDALACATHLDGELEIEDLKDATRGLLGAAYGPVIAREASPLTALAVDPSGCHVAWGRADGALRRWNHCEPGEAPQTTAGNGAIRALWLGAAVGLAIDRRGRALRWTPGDGGEPTPLELTGAPAAARALALAEGAQLLALASDDGRSIAIYDLGQGATAIAPAVISELGEPVTALALTPEGSALLAAQGREVGLWPLRRGRPGKRKALATHEAAITRLQAPACAPQDGPSEVWALSGDEAGAVIARPLGSKRRGPPPLVGLAQPVEEVALTRACRHVLGAAGRSLFVWDLGARDPAATPRELRHERPIAAIAPGDGDEAVITAAAGEVHLWDLSRPADAPRRLHHPRALIAMDLVPGTGSLIAGFEDGSIRRWDLGASTSGAAATLAHHPAPVRAAAIDREGGRLVAAAGDQAILWQIDGRGRMRQGPLLDGQAGAIVAAALRDDGLWAATADDDGQLLLWSLAGATPGAHPFAIARGARRLAFTERHLVVAGSRGACAVALSDLDQRRCQELPHAGEVSHLAALPGTGKVVLGGSSGALSLIDLDAHARGGIATTTLPKGQGMVTALAVSDDGGWLAAAAEGGELRLWRLVQGAADDPEGLRLAGSTGPIYALALAADGRWLAAAGEDRTIRIYRPGGDASPEVTLEQGESPATALAFTRAALLSGAGDGTLRAWMPGLAGERGWQARTIGRQPGTIRALLVGEAEAQVIAASDDPALYLWPLAARALAERAQAIAGPP